MNDLERERENTIAKNRQDSITHLATKGARLAGLLKKQRATSAPASERTKTQRELDATLAELGRLEAVSKLEGDAS